MRLAMRLATRRGRPGRARPAPHALGRAVRRGMTLVEVIVSLVILTGATLTMGGFIGRFAHTASVSNLRATALELVADRIETVRQAPAYATMETDYRLDEARIAGYPDFRRSTVLSHVTRTIRGGTDDYMLVTVVVSHPSLGAPIKKTTIVSAF